MKLDIHRRPVLLITLMILVSLPFAFRGPGPVPAPFGLELGKAVQGDLVPFGGTPVGTHRLTGGLAFELDVEKMGQPGLTGATAAFGKDGTLAALLLDFAHVRHSVLDGLVETVQQKYHVEKNQIGQGFGQLVATSGNCRIEINRSGFDAYMFYATADYVKSAAADMKAKEAAEPAARGAL